jgi:hypothetical protein
MTTNEILELLISERDKLNLAIAALQGASTRGRKPADATATAGQQPARKRPARTLAQRQAQAEKMRQYWAARKKAEAKEAAKEAKK